MVITRRISALLRFLLPLLGVLLAVALTACVAQDAASTAEDGVLWDPMLTETEVCRNFNGRTLDCVYWLCRHMDTHMQHVSFRLVPIRVDNRASLRISGSVYTTPFPTHNIHLDDPVIHLNWHLMFST